MAILRAKPIPVVKRHVVRALGPWQRWVGIDPAFLVTCVNIFVTGHRRVAVQQLHSPPTYVSAEERYVATCGDERLHVGSLSLTRVLIVASLRLLLAQLMLCP